MKLLNEPIARAANTEDKCKGHFWESRFKSQALLDETALAACMAYVDLNSVRANIAKTPEKSAYTSVKKRNDHSKKAKQANHPDQQCKGLMPFIGNPRMNQPPGLPFKLTEYLELVDWTGRIVRSDKRGAIAKNLPPILSRLNIEVEQWCYLTQNFESQFKGLVGSVISIKTAVKALGKQWSLDTKTSLSVFRTSR